uniref:hypothetical protein n=1 Tax=Candidatus Ichthyocystis sparus TaxID=1561004 RepID=UPI001F5F08BB
MAANVATERLQLTVKSYRSLSCTVKRDHLNLKAARKKKVQDEGLDFITPTIAKTVKKDEHLNLDVGYS